MKFAILASTLAIFAATVSGTSNAIAAPSTLEILSLSAQDVPSSNGLLRMAKHAEDEDSDSNLSDAERAQNRADSITQDQNEDRPTVSRNPNERRKRPTSGFFHFMRTILGRENR